jgi:hypothetical protein
MTKNGHRTIQKENVSITLLYTNAHRQVDEHQPSTDERAMGVVTL